MRQDVIYKNVSITSVYLPTTGVYEVTSTDSAVQYSTSECSTTSIIRHFLLTVMVETDCVWVAQEGKLLPALSHGV